MTFGYCSATVAYREPHDCRRRAVAGVFRWLGTRLFRVFLSSGRSESGVIAERGRRDVESGPLTHKEFMELTERYAGLINKICFTYCESTDDFSDLRQDVMLNLWRGISGFRGQSTPITWIYRVAINTCVSAVRKRSRRFGETPIELIDLAEPDSQDDDRVAWLYESISRLGKIDRALILMRLDGLTYDEIADVSGLSRSTAATRIRRIIAFWARERRNIGSRNI